MGLIIQLDLMGADRATRLFLTPMHQWYVVIIINYFFLLFGTFKKGFIL